MVHGSDKEKGFKKESLENQDIVRPAYYIKSNVPESEIEKVYSLSSPAFKIQLGNILKASCPKAHNKKTRALLALVISLLSITRPREMGRWLLSAIEGMSDAVPELHRLSNVAKKGGEDDLDIFTRRVYFCTDPMNKELAEEIASIMLIVGEDCEDFSLWSEAKYAFERAYEVTVITAGMNSEYKELAAFGVARTNYYYNQEEYKKSPARQVADEAKSFISSDEVDDSENFQPQHNSVFSVNKEEPIFADIPDVGKRTGQIRLISQLMGFVLMLLGVWGIASDMKSVLKETGAAKFTIDTVLKVTVEEPTFFSLILLSGMILIIWPLLIKVHRTGKIHRKQSVTVEHSTPEGETSSKSLKAHRIDEHDSPD